MTTSATDHAEAGAMISVSLSVNGQHRVIDCSPGDTLMEALRGPLGLTGTKSGCGIGYCGACTVLVDGAAAHSCCLLAATADGREITTIEGISPPGEAAAEAPATLRGSAVADVDPGSAPTGHKDFDGRAGVGEEFSSRASAPGVEGLDLVQAAFLEAGAVQCGYCTPGFVMSVKALLAENPTPSEAEIRQYLTGNICRCSGFAAIVRAVVAVAAREAP